MNSTKDIAKLIRNDLKAFPGFKFSVTIETYSGGSSINVDVMASPGRMIRTMAEIPDVSNSLGWGHTRDAIAGRQKEKYHQLNQYQCKDEYKPDTWNNGVFLTEYGHNELKRIVAVVEKYHRDSSDSSIDYFNCNFYFHLNLGKWDNPFVDGVGAPVIVPAACAAVEV